MHIHAKNMELYAKDAKENDCPWLGWEFKNPSGIFPTEWRPCPDHPHWSPGVSYRRSPEMQPKPGIWTLQVVKHRSGVTNHFKCDGKTKFCIDDQHVTGLQILDILSALNRAVTGLSRVYRGAPSCPLS